MPLADYAIRCNEPGRAIALKLFAYLAVAGCIVGLVYTVLMLLPSAKEMGMKYHGIDQWGDNALKWVTPENVGKDGFYAWKYVISIMSALFSFIKTWYEFTESIFLANRLSDADHRDEADPHQATHRDSYLGNKADHMRIEHLVGGMILLLLLALTNAMPIYDVGFKTLMFGVKVVMFAVALKYVGVYMHPHGFRSFGHWITLGYFEDDSHDHDGHSHDKKGSDELDGLTTLLNETGGFGYNKDSESAPSKLPPRPEEADSEPVNRERASTEFSATTKHSPKGASWNMEISSEGDDSALPTPDEPNRWHNMLVGGSESSDRSRRLAAFDVSSVLGTLMVTLVSILVWYLFLRAPASQVKPRRRTTITKKRPTFVKGKRRASRKPTLSTLRSESTLLN